MCQCAKFPLQLARECDEYTAYVEKAVGDKWTRLEELWEKCAIPSEQRERIRRLDPS